MTISRRSLIEAGTLASLSAALSSIPASAQAALPRRRSINQLALNDPIVQTLRDGVRILKAKPANDPLNRLPRTPSSWIR